MSIAIHLRRSGRSRPQHQAPLPRADQPACGPTVGPRGARRRTGVASTTASIAAHVVVLVAIAFATREAVPGDGPDGDAVAVLVASFDEETLELDDDIVELLEPLEVVPEPPLLDRPMLEPEDSEVEPPPVLPDLPELCVAVHECPYDDTLLPADAFRRRGPPEPEPVAAQEPPAVVAPAPRPPAPRSALPARKRAGTRTPLRIVHVPNVRDYYPKDALRRGTTGTVVVEVVVDAGGSVTSARVARSSGDAGLDTAGLRLAQRVRFARGDGGTRRAHLPVVFDLR